MAAKQPTLLERHRDILLSPRTQQVFVIFLIQVSEHYGLIDAFVAEALRNLVGAILAIGVADKVAEKIGNVRTK